MAKTSKDLKFVKTVPDKAADILLKYRERVSATKGKKLLSAEEKQAHIEELTSKAVDDLKDLRAEGNLAAMRIRSAGGKSQGDTSDRQLSETRKQRAWDRIKPILDSSSDVKNVHNGTLPDTLQTIQDAVKTADADTYQALREELVPYFNSKGLDYYTGIVDVLLKPGQALARDDDAIEVEGELGTGWKRVETALSQVEHAITSSVHPVTKGAVSIDQDYDIPDWDDGSTITIEGVATETEEKDDFGRTVATKNLPSWAD